MLSSFLQPQCREISDQEMIETLQVFVGQKRECVFHLFLVFLICPFKLNSWAHFLLWKCSRCLEFQWCFLCIDYSSENQHFAESIFTKKTEGSIQEVKKFKKSIKYRHMSISGGAQYVTLQKYFSHPSFITYLFPTPPMKLKLVLQIGGRLLIVNHLDQSLRLANQKQGAFSGRCLVLGFAVPFTGKLCKNTGPKPFCWAKPTCFDLSNFNLQGHILSTNGVALRVSEWRSQNEFSDMRRT
jgi:hypothetical protein